MGEERHHARRELDLRRSRRLVPATIVPDLPLFRLDASGSATDEAEPEASEIVRSAVRCVALWSGDPCRLADGVLSVPGPGRTWRPIGSGPEHAPHRAALAEILAARAPDGDYELVGPGTSAADLGLDRPQLWRVGGVEIPDVPTDDRERVAHRLRGERIAGVAWAAPDGRRVVAMRRAYSPRGGRSQSRSATPEAVSLPP